jgi:hypothetical protein
MIKEKPLQKKAKHYADGVVSALTSGRRKTQPVRPRWDHVQGLIEAAYFNGFQSGVVWQKGAADNKPYDIVTTKVDVGLGRKQDMYTAQTPDGHYIGEPQFAEELFLKYGITRFELRVPTSSVCSVGFNPKTKKWYGWSHRAIKGFGTRAAAAQFAESVS